METIVVGADETPASEEIQLTAVAAAGSAAGVAAANAAQAEGAAQEATEVAAGTALLADNAANAAARAEQAADTATEAEYATAMQVSAVNEKLDEIMTVLAARAAQPPPEAPKPRTTPQRDKAPDKPKHWLRRNVGGGNK